MGHERGAVRAVIGVFAILLCPVPSFAQQTGNIREGDVIEVHVAGQDELSQRYVVQPDGSVTLPLAGVVPLAGLSAESATARLAIACSTLGRSFG